MGLVEWRRGRRDELFGFGSLSPLVALLATIAIAAYTAALMTTTVADVMVIYATIPFVAAAIGWLVNREAVDRRTLIASVVALAGVAVIFINGLGSGRLGGQALSALTTVAFAGMIVLQRRRPKASMIAVNAVGALGAGAIGLSLSPHPSLGPFDLAVLFVYGLTTIGLAFVVVHGGREAHSLRRSRAHQPARRCARARSGCLLPSARTQAS